MDGYYGFGAEVLFYEVFGAGGEGVCFGECEFAVHLGVKFDGYDVAYAAGAQVVDVPDAGDGGCEADDFFLLRFGKRGFEEFADGRAYDVVSALDDEETDYDGGDGVEDAPVAAEEHGSGDAYECAAGGDGVAAVVPRVGYDNLRVGVASGLDCETVKPLL